MKRKIKICSMCIIILYLVIMAFTVKNSKSQLESIYCDVYHYNYPIPQKWDSAEGDAGHCTCESGETYGSGCTISGGGS